MIGDSGVSESCRSTLPPTPDLDRQLDRVSNARIGQDSVAWTISSVFGAAEAVFVAAYVTRPEAFLSPLTSIALSVVGVLSSSVWLSILSRALYHIKRLEDIIRKLESDLQIPDAQRLSMSVPGRPPARDVMRRSVAAATAMWAIELVRKLWSV